MLVVVLVFMVLVFMAVSLAPFAGACGRVGEPGEGG
jgi:hypothetical protein